MDSQALVRKDASMIDNESKADDRTFAVDVVRQLRAAGHEAVWAGGCVRDALLGITGARHFLGGLNFYLGRWVVLTRKINLCRVLGQGNGWMAIS